MLPGHKIGLESCQKRLDGDRTLWMHSRIRMLKRPCLDQEEKKQRPQQEGPRPRHVRPLLELLAMRWQGQGHQAFHREEHG